ncbi:unnamed protein product, partial [Rangifer tarandus platyrhynchus]
MGIHSGGPGGTSLNPCHEPETEGSGGYCGLWEQIQAGVQVAGGAPEAQHSALPSQGQRQLQ